MTFLTVLPSRLIQSLFEAAMYIFVFEWTPTLTKTAENEGEFHLELGAIFTAQMVAMMLGSSIFQAGIKRSPNIEWWTLPMYVCEHSISLISVSVSRSLGLSVFLSFSFSFSILSFFIFLFSHPYPNRLITSPGIPLQRCLFSYLRSLRVIGDGYSAS